MFFFTLKQYLTAYICWTISVLLSGKIYINYIGEARSLIEMTICMVSVDLHAVASISAHMSSAYYIIIEMETLIFFSCYIVSLNLVPVQQKRLQSFSEKEGKKKI